MLFWFLFFKVPISGLDYRRMVSCCFMKDGGSIKRIWLVKKMMEEEQNI